jgi:uncharacterized protein YkwD
MIVKTLLCASVLLLSPGSENKTQAAPENGLRTKQQVEQKSTPEARLIARLLAKLVSRHRPKQLDLLPIEANIVEYTNAERAKYGLASLEVDRSLMQSARAHASWMASNRRLVHTRRPVAENIAMGQPHSLSVVRDWMSSPGHRANILNRGYRRIGVAAYRTPGGTIYWCEQFQR